MIVMPGTLVVASMNVCLEVSVAERCSVTTSGRSESLSGENFGSDVVSLLCSSDRVVIIVFSLSSLGDELVGIGL